MFHLGGLGPSHPLRFNRGSADLFSLELSSAAALEASWHPRGKEERIRGVQKKFGRVKQLPADLGAFVRTRDRRLMGLISLAKILELNDKVVAPNFIIASL